MAIAQEITLETWELAAPANLQYRPAHVRPGSAGVWGNLRSFQTLREAIKAAITDPAPASQVAWILTSGGRTLEPPQIEDLWLQLQASQRE